MLNAKQSKQLISLLNKIDARHELSVPIFEALSKVVFYVACELVIVGKDGILLTRRDDKWWKGWHFPGGLLRYREAFGERISEVASRELGVKIKNYKFLFPLNNNKSKRGPVVSLVFLCEINGKAKGCEYFKKMPKDIIFEHKNLWKKLVGYI